MMHTSIGAAAMPVQLSLRATSREPWRLKDSARNASTVESTMVSGAGRLACLCRMSEKSEPVFELKREKKKS